jgi:hypothetical protein
MENNSAQREPRRSWDRSQAARGSLILNRLVPAPDHGAGFRRDPETGFVYYSSEWLGDAREKDECAH